MTGKWDVDLADKMQWPLDKAVLAALDLWSFSEDSDGTGVRSVYNFLATTWPVSGLPPWNSFTVDGVTYHVQRYANEKAGVDATYTALNQNRYSIINQAMNVPLWKGKLENIFYAINGSAWCGHCQKGKYPIRLYDFLHGHIASQPSRVLIPQKGPEPSRVPMTIFSAWNELTLQLRRTVPKEIRRIEASRRLISRAVK